ncbi:hypothetical protein PsorP6_006919 [Peronosclerospora sorghi]|uniref:Uncharacterized protein n=1 Tax=Peronosclerospora sorghi TaxID=230839 RepID=A0ACC0W8N9_9STRA|nr:hypothetical protein PsorP6_006919 [Peronosclerospora sorghi]
MRRNPPVPGDGPWIKFEKEVTESIAYVIDEVTTIDFENLITTSRVRRHNQDFSAGYGRVVTYQAPEQVARPTRSSPTQRHCHSGAVHLKRWKWDTLLLENEGSAEVGPAVSAEVSVAVRAQVSDNVAEVAGVVSEVAQVATAAVSITVAEADATPVPEASFANFQHRVQRLLPVPPVVRNPAAVRTKDRPRNSSRIPSGVEASMAARQTKRRRCGRCREYGHDGKNHDRIMMERSATVVEEVNRAVAEEG